MCSWMQCGWTLLAVIWVAHYYAPDCTCSCMYPVVHILKMTYPV